MEQKVTKQEKQVTVSLSKDYQNELWLKGSLEKYRFFAQLSRNSSSVGINSGRVSKLTIFRQDNRYTTEILNYDRGWIIKSPTEEQEMIDIILNTLEQYPY